MSVPRVARALLSRLLRGEHREFILGDLEELYLSDVQRAGALRAWLRYWRRGLGSVFSPVGRSAGAPGMFARGRWWGALDVDARVALRGLLRRPGFSLPAAATLALGLGSATAIFALVNAVLLRPVPGVRAPDELAMVELLSADGTRDALSLPNLRDVRDAVPGVRGMSASLSLQLHVGRGAEGASAVSGEAVESGYFGVLGVTPMLGRLIEAAEAEPGSGALVAVISERLWAGRYDRSPDVVGRMLHANGHMLEIVGVAGGGFVGVERGRASDVWVPLDAYGTLRHFPDELRRTFLGERGRGLFFGGVFIRRDGATTIDALQTRMRAALARLAAAYPGENAGLAEYTATVFPGVGLATYARASAATLLRLMAGLSVVVLLIACANVANLLLFRSVGRASDTAVRRALGASPLRVASQLLMESGFLALAGMIGGLGVAYGLVAVLGDARMFNLPDVTAQFDVRVLLFAMVTVVVTPVLFGSVPALLASRRDPASELRSGARETGGWGRLRRGLATLQLALSLGLLVGALLLARTVSRLSAVEVGFDPEGVYTLFFDPAPQGYDDAATDALYRRMLARVGAVSGTRSVAIATSPPFTGAFFMGPVHRPEAAADVVIANRTWITPDYFDVLGLSILRGRDFGEADWGAASDAAVLSASLAHALFGDADPVGRSVVTREARTLRVIGVVSDVHTRVAAGEPTPLLYQPLSERPVAAARVVVRAAQSGGPPADGQRRNPLDVVTALREAARAVDPAVPISMVEPLADGIRDSFVRERMLARLLTILAGLAVTLALVGLYALIAHGVARRTREIGIRVALGATESRVLGLVLREAVTIAGAGALIGLVGAQALTRVLENRLFGITPLDPVTWAVAAAVFAVVTLVAGIGPARAAARVDPLTALRSD